MRITTVLPLVAVSTAFVIPDEQVLSSLAIENHETPSSSFFDSLPSKDQIIDHVEFTFKDAVAFSQNAIDQALDYTNQAIKKSHEAFQCANSLTAFDVDGWLSSGIDTLHEVDIFDGKSEHPHHPHHPPHGKHPHHHRPTKTVYELINESKYTTKLAKLINEYDDIVDILNGTAANYTIFAPTDRAFEKIPDHHKYKPSKELIKKILSYHVAADFYPAGRVLLSHTIPTTLGEEGLGGEAQRLHVGIGLKGLAVNFYSRVVAVDIFGTNGVIHGVDSLLLPPPPAYKILELLPGEFSTLTLGLGKTGLLKVIADNTTHEGGTLFAPSNFAFRKLGPRINAFLFSQHGEKYLKALLGYHVVANDTLYSDAFYKAKDAETEVDAEDIPKGHFHVDLPTLLKDKSLSIDVARYGRWITIKINGFSTVSVQDGIAKDGVIHVLSSVLIPPKTPGGLATEATEDMSIEEFKQRLLPYTEELEL